MINLGRKLKALRITKDLKGIDLANALKVSKGTISNWESGTKAPTISTLIEIAKFYGVSPAYFFEDETESISVKGLSNNQVKIIHYLINAFMDENNG